MAGNSIITGTEIKIQEYNNNNPVLFSNLSLSESFVNVNHFSFSLRPSDSKSTLSSIFDFKQKVLGNNVEIIFKNNAGDKKHTFNGIITEINSNLIDNQYYEFSISGAGIFCKVNEINEFHSFYATSLKDIINSAFGETSLMEMLNSDPQLNKRQHYIVQYDQTLFAFLSSLAIRFGEWMYYDGEKMQFGKKPEGAPIVLRAAIDITNLNIQAHSIKNTGSLVSADIFRSETLVANQKESVPENSLIKSASQSGDETFENPRKASYTVSGFKQDALNDTYKLKQQALYASSACITGSTLNNELSIGKIIKITDEDDTNGKSFIISQINHFVNINSQYYNSFTAIPLEVNVPPYTNTDYFPRAKAQSGIITDNEDDSGLARVKVKFPWMKDSEKSPWISMLTPHAGKDKGFRFLPEKEDEVMVDFWDGNAELPYVAGALYTSKNHSGVPESGNNVKIIGSRSGRRLEIDDDKGTVRILDYVGDKDGNSLKMEQSDGKNEIIISSGSSSEFVNIVLDGKENKIGISAMNGGDPMARIVWDGKTKKISISSKGSIDIQTDGDLSLSAKNIEMTASKNISFTAGEETTFSSGTDIGITSGAKTEITAGTDIKGTAGVNAEIMGGAQLKLTAGAVANLKGAIVNIN